jgi:ribosomal protein S18 acetylase RimI-like enzyme
MKILTHSDEVGVYRDIWLSWFRSFGCEADANDEYLVSNPQHIIVNLKGQVFYAYQETIPIGVIYIAKLSSEQYEICKLAVDKRYRGLGAGKALVEACLSFARAQSAKHVYLQTIKALDVAIVMYKKMGFIDSVPSPFMTVMKRTQVIMRYNLK